MLTRIQVTTVFVSDQDKAKDFYINKLGMTERVDMVMGENFRWVEVVPEGAQTSISLAMPWPGSENGVGGPTGMIFDTADVKALHADWKAKGVNFTQEPTEQPWGGIEAKFVDPDGNEFSVAQR